MLILGNPTPPLIIGGLNNPRLTTMYTIQKKSVSQTGKFWLTVASLEGGFVGKSSVAQVTEALYNNLTLGQEIKVPQDALRPVDSLGER